MDHVLSIFFLDVTSARMLELSWLLNYLSHRSNTDESSCWSRTVNLKLMCCIMRYGATEVTPDLVRYELSINSIWP